MRDQLQHKALGPVAAWVEGERGWKESVGGAVSSDAGKSAAACFGQA